MRFKFVGGNLCLDFINTVGDHLTDRRKEYLNSYDDLISWGIASGIIKSSDEKSLLKTGNHNPAKAGKVLKRAIKLREILFDILSAMAIKKDYPPSLLIDFNVYVAETLKHLEIQTTKNKISWSWHGSENNPEQIIWTITWSAAHLLIDKDLKFLKICADDLCGWLFLDSSKNKRRSWCDMKDCGNRNKFRRYYSRNKSKK